MVAVTYNHFSRRLGQAGLGFAITVTIGDAAAAAYARYVIGLH